MCTHSIITSKLMRGLTQRFHHHLYQQSPPFDVNDRPHQARNAAAPLMAKRIGRCHAQQTVAPPLSQMDQRLCAILRGDVLSRAQHDALTASPHLLVTLETHGITSLIYHNLRRQHIDADHQDKGWQGKGWAALAQLARQQAAVSLWRATALQHVLDNLVSNDIFPLLLKGMPLGYTHYPAPEMRPCCDTDLLVRQHDRQQVDRVLRDLGYTPYPMPSGRFVMHQLTYAKAGLADVQHVIDVHWKISNRQVCANCLLFDELAPEARPVPQLGENAFALASIHALLHACLHRIAHQDQRDRLIWLYDLHLLVNRMTPDEREQFADLANRKGLRAVCDSSLSRAQQCFATRLPLAWLATLQTPGSQRQVEASAYFLTPRQRPWQLLELFPNSGDGRLSSSNNDRGGLTDGITDPR